MSTHDTAESSGRTDAGAAPFIWTAAADDTLAKVAGQGHPEARRATSAEQIGAQHYV